MLEATLSTFRCFASDKFLQREIEEDIEIERERESICVHKQQLEKTFA